ncbi:MAG TPA: ABC transporter substrate-binding protein [Streptosporangiaceae bacterium]
MAAAAAVTGSLLLTVGCSSSNSSSGSASGTTGSGTNWATASSVAAGGGMTALVAAAKKEGTLNVITLPANWANYGTIMKDFTAKYGIKINDANPDGSSQDELNAVNQLRGQDRAPDMLDMGTAFAVKGTQQGILAPYKVASWASIPADAKASDGTWFADYGGYVAIGYNSDKVKTPPTSFADLLKPRIQEPGSHQRQPDPGQRRVLGRVRLGPGQRRLAGQHHARRLLLQEAALRRQLRAGRGQRGDHGERPDPDHRLVGLPARVRDWAER